MTTNFNETINDKIILLANDLRLLSFKDYKSIIQNNASFDENLLELLNEEHKRKNELKITQNIRSASFPNVKTFDTFDMSDEWVSSNNINSINNFKSCDFISKKHDIIIFGPSGRGKTHLSIAIGFEAIKKGFKVLFKQADTMISEISEAKSDKKLSLYINKIMKIDLLIIDELGYSSYNNDEANYLYRIISNRYEKCSTIITTNYIFTSWKEFINDEIILKAIIDRLVHHSYIKNMNSHKSYRFHHAQSRKEEIQE
jgi:DNA replication protein DnaC